MKSGKTKLLASQCTGSSQWEDPEAEPALLSPKLKQIEDYHWKKKEVKCQVKSF